MAMKYKTEEVKLHTGEGVSDIIKRLEGMPEDPQALTNLLFVGISSAYFGGFSEVSIIKMVVQQLEVVKDQVDDQ